MSVNPYITASGTDKYRNTVSNVTDAIQMLNQFEQRETIITQGIDSIVAGTNVTVDNTDPHNPIVSADTSGNVETIVPGTGIAVNSSDPANPIVSSTVLGIVQSIVPGTHITVDNTDPANPIVTATATINPVSLTSIGGDYTLVADGSGPDLEINGLTPGDGIGISLGSGFLTITSTHFDSPLTALLAYPGSSVEPYVAGTLPASNNWYAVGFSQLLGPSYFTATTPTVTQFNVANNVGSEIYLECNRSGWYTASPCFTFSCSAQVSAGIAMFKTSNNGLGWSTVNSTCREVVLNDQMTITHSCTTSIQLNSGDIICMCIITNNHNRLLLGPSMSTDWIGAAGLDPNGVSHEVVAMASLSLSYQATG